MARKPYCLKAYRTNRTTSRISEVVDKHQVNILYTVTAIHFEKGNEAVEGTSRDS